MDLRLYLKIQLILVEPDEDEIEDSPGVSKFGAIFIVCNAALGAGLLNFPHAYALAGGWPVCLGLQVAVMALALVGLHYLASGARHSGKNFKFSFEMCVFRNFQKVKVSILFQPL